MQIIIAAVVLVALIAWIVVKNDEMSGLGRNVKVGSLRHPHGKLVRAKATTAVPDEIPLIDRFKRSMPCISSFVLTAACVVLYTCDFTILDHTNSQLLATLSSTGIVALIIAAEATLRAPEAARTFWTYVYALVAGFYAPSLCGSALQRLPLCRLTRNRLCLSTALRHAFATCLALVHVLRCCRAR